ELLRQRAGDPKAELGLRAHAVVGLAQSAGESAATRKLLLSLTAAPELRRDALRSLRGAALSDDERRTLLAWWEAGKFAPAERGELAAQLLLVLDGKGEEKVRAALAAAAGKRPEGEAQWRKALTTPGDAAAGER